MRYDFARKIVKQVENEGKLDEILKPDGKLKSQKALIDAAKSRGYELTKENCFFKGHPMNFAYCLEQYGSPLLGKSASKLSAHRINIECFLKYSNTESDDEKLKEYYRILRECKFSQYCCGLLKKKPSELLQAELDVDVIIKGLMAEESHARMLSFATRGHIFESHRPHIKDGPFYHVNPLGLWSEEDIWNYIHKYNVEYSPLYDITYTAEDGTEHHIERNGCMFCGTDIQFKDNHLSVLRQTHPKAWKVCMEKYGYRDQLLTLFRLKKNKNILNCSQPVIRSAQMMEYADDAAQITDIRPCVFDDFGEMVDIKGTGIEGEYDPEFQGNIDSGTEELA